MKKCDKCNQTIRRSNPQNNRLHLLFHEIAERIKASDGELHNAMWWKVMMKDRWLGYDEFTSTNGETKYVLRSTSNLGVDELNSFMERVEHFAAKHGVYLQD